MSHNYRLLPCSCLVLGMLAGFAAGAAPALAMDDDLALDMGLDFEEYSAPSTDINGSASPAPASQNAASANSKPDTAPVSKSSSSSTSNQVRLLPLKALPLPPQNQARILPLKALPTPSPARRQTPQVPPPPFPELTF